LVEQPAAQEVRLAPILLVTYSVELQVVQLGAPVVQEEQVDLATCSVDLVAVMLR
jgi:hypothetical protein